MKCRSLSSSKIKTYKDCAFKYYIESHLMLDTGKSFAAEQGSLIHFVLERFALAKKNGKDDQGRTLDWLEKNWKDLLFKGYMNIRGEWEDGYRGKNPIWHLSKDAVNADKKCDKCPFFDQGTCGITGTDIATFNGCPKKQYNEAVRLIEKVLDPENVDSPLNQKIVDSENRFEIIIKDGDEDVKVSGFIDVVTELDEETIEIHDYKTGKYIQSYEDAQKDPQMLIYHFAAREEYPQYKHVIVNIYYLRRKGGALTLTFDIDDKNKTEIALKHYWHKIKKDENPRRRCDFPNGAFKGFDWKCKAMCNPELCQAVHNQFLEDGRKITDDARLFADKTD